MKKFYCYGKKGFCEEREEHGICPQNCPYIDNTGG